MKHFKNPQQINYSTNHGSSYADRERTHSYTTYIYRVIHKSVKHFKNPQQINYSTDHGSSYADGERTHSYTAYIRGLLEKYPTFGREKETGLLGALDT